MKDMKMWLIMLMASCIILLLRETIDLRCQMASLHEESMRRMQKQVPQLLNRLAPSLPMPGHDQ